MQAQDIAKKKYIGKSVTANFNMFFMFAPYLFNIYFIIERDFCGSLLFVLLCLINSYLMYLTTGIRAIGTLTIDKEKINVKKNFAPEFLCFQKEINIELKDIAFIEFVWVSNDAFEKNPRHYWTLPFIKFYLNNEEIIYINVLPYSKKQWIDIEKN